MIISILVIIVGFILIKYGVGFVLGGGASLIGQLGLKKGDEDSEDEE